MKKFLTMLTALFVFAAVPVYAANNPITSFFERFYTFNSDVNTKVALLQKRNAEQQKKYEAKKAEQEKKILEQQGNIMVTDVRVPHEYQVFKDAGAISIRVEADRDIRSKRGELIGENDITETGLDDVTDWDYVVYNNSDYETLVKKAHELIGELK